MEQDDREGSSGLLDTLLPDNWDAMDMLERRAFFPKEAAHDGEGTVRRTTVCNMESGASASARIRAS
jgi:hypothetical protein